MDGWMDKSSSSSCSSRLITHVAETCAHEASKRLDVTSAQRVTPESRAFNLPSTGFEEI